MHAQAMNEPPVFPSVDAEIRALLGRRLGNYLAYSSPSKRAHRLEALLAQDVDGCRSRINAPSDGHADVWLEQALACASYEVVAVLLHYGADPFLFRPLKHQRIVDQVAALQIPPLLQEYLRALLNTGLDVNVWLDPLGDRTPPLILAVRGRHPFVVRWLLGGRHANVNALDGQTFNAMYWTLHGFDEAWEARGELPAALWEILRLLTAAGARMSQWRGRFPEIFRMLTRRNAG